MTDLSSLGFKESNKDEAKHESENIYDKLESVIGKTASDILKKQNEQSNSDNSFEIPEAPYISPNPIEKTNEQLEILVNESLSNSASGKRWNRIALVLSLVSIGIAIIAFNSSNDSSRKLEEILRKRNNLIENQNKPVAVTEPSIKSKSEVIVIPPEVVQEKAKAAINKESKI